MKRLSPLPLLVPVAMLCLGLGAVEGWLLQRARGEAAQALTGLKQKKQERDWLAGQAPALSPENEAALATDLAAAGRLLAEWRAALQGDEPDRSDPPPPGQSIDAFIELTGFIGQLRAQAGQTQVALRPDERFGFGTYAHEGPVAEQIAVVRRQRLAAQYLVGMLLESHPQALLAVRRERPGVEAARDQRTPGDDFFELDRALRLRQPGQVESEAFRLEFTGQTETLRHFLNSLAASRRPVAVRSVEAEPLAADSPPRGTPPVPRPGAVVALVKPAPLRFGVILELIRLADNSAAPAP